MRFKHFRWNGIEELDEWIEKKAKPKNEEKNQMKVNDI